MCVLVYLGLLAEELKSYGIQDIFVFCTRGELSKYRVPNLVGLYHQYGIITHHHPIPDGGTPDIASCCDIMEELEICLKNNRKTLIQYVFLFSIYYVKNVPVKMISQIIASLCSYYLPYSLLQGSKGDNTWKVLAPCLAQSKHSDICHYYFWRVRTINE